MKSSFLLALSLLAAPAFAGEPADDVKAATKKLGDAANYSWSSKTAVAPQGNNNRFQPPSVEGKTTKGGCAYLVTTMGDRTTEAIVKAGKSATKTDTGWKTPEEMRAAREAAGGGAGGGGGQGSGQGGARRGGGGFGGGRSLENFKTPAEQAEALVGQAKELKKDGDAVAGALTDEAVKAQLSFGGGRRPDGTEPPAATDAKGSVKFWLKDGALAKYEVHVEGKFSRNGNDITIDRTTTTEIKDVGTTKVDVPEEATKKLESSPAPKAEEKKSA